MFCIKLVIKPAKVAKTGKPSWEIHPSAPENGKKGMKKEVKTRKKWRK